MERTYYWKGPEPRAHQDDAFYFAYPKPFFALFHEQGTGKTKTLLNVAGNRYREKLINLLVVVAPNGVHVQWARDQIPEHCPCETITYIWDSSASDRIETLRAFLEDKTEALKVLCVNIEAFSYDTYIDLFNRIMRSHETMLVVDEATRIKNPSSNRTENLMYNVNDCTWETYRRDKYLTKIEYVSKYRAILTGMPVDGSPFNCWSMMEFLTHYFFELDFVAFKARHGIQKQMSTKNSKGRTFQTKVTSREINAVRKYAEMGKDVETIAVIMKISESSVRFLLDNPHVKSPYKYLDKLKAKLREVGHFVRKSECLDLEDKVFTKVLIELTSEQKRAMRELKKELSTQYKDARLDIMTKISLIGRFQQITGGFFPGVAQDGASVLLAFDNNPKMEALLARLEEASDWPIIVVACYVEEIKAITETLIQEYPERTVRCIYGATKVEDRTAYREAFQRGEIDLLVVNPATTSTGFNLQRASNMIFYSNDYSLEHREQMEDRTHRDGQERTAIYTDLVCRGSIDERILAVLKEKRDLLEYIRDASVGQFLGGEDE
jgi:superfamily II DNA or RNA helicase